MASFETQLNLFWITKVLDYARDAIRHYLGENLTGHLSDDSGHHLNSWDQLQQTENEQSTASSPPCSKLPSMDTCSLTLKFYFDSRLAPASVSLPPPPQNSQSINFSRSLSLFLICEPFSFRCSFRGGGRTIRWTSFAKHTFQSDSRHSSRPVQWNYLVLAISLQQSENWSPSFHKSQYCRCSIIWTTACCLKMKQWSGSPCKLLRISAASGIFIHLPWNHCFGVNHKQIVIVS